MTTVLLDKGVIRRAYERQVRLIRGIVPTYAQDISTLILAKIILQGFQGYVTKETYNALMSRSTTIGSSLLSDIRVLEKGKYLRRWARRLRDFGFTREDSVILSNGIFGVDTIMQTLGVSIIVTTDLRMIRNYRGHFDDIDTRLRNMKKNLLKPYFHVEFPELISVTEMRNRLTS